MGVVKLQVIHSFHALFAEISLFIYTCTKEKNNVSKDYCIAHHYDKMCFPSNCRYHITIIGDFEKLFRKLNAFCFTYQHMDCVYTLFKCRLCDKKVDNSGQLLDNVPRGVCFNQKSEGVDRMPSIAKLMFLRTKYLGIYGALSWQQNQRKLVDQSLQEELSKLRGLNMSEIDGGCWLLPGRLW